MFKEKDTYAQFKKNPSSALATANQWQFHSIIFCDEGWIAWNVVPIHNHLLIYSCTWWLSRSHIIREPLEYLHNV